jgi:hypothetical protein
MIIIDMDLTDLEKKVDSILDLDRDSQYEINVYVETTKRAGVRTYTSPKEVFELLSDVWPIYEIKADNFILEIDINKLEGVEK